MTAIMNHNDAPNMQQSYPSPNAVAADNGGPFYSSSQNQQQSANLSTPEELQLAAQLSRNMAAPSMNSGAVMDGMPVQDPRAQQGAVNHQYQQDPQGHAVHDHHQVHQQHANNAQMDQMGGQYGSPLADSSMAGRKRSKVSRACDECRRKKIRCDASEESGDGVQCSNCKRVGTECQFSRVPMKRGPSKGYIKELADRLNTLEGALQAGEMPQQHLPHHESSYQRRPSDEFSPVAPLMEQARKRSFSSISNDFGTPYQSQRPPTGWASQESARHVSHPSPATFPPPQLAAGTPQMFRDPNYSPNGLQPVANWRNAPDAPRRQSNSFDGIAQLEQGQLERVPIDAGLIQEYYTIIHPTYPLLSQSESEPISKFAGPASRDSLLQALYTTVRSFPSEQSRSTQPVSKSGRFDHNSRSGNLAQLQTLLLQVIEADNCDPISQRSHSKPSSSMLLGSAVGLAYSLKLHVHKQADKVSDSDTDYDESLERRLWWSLVVMDKWHATSTSSPVLIPDAVVVFYPEDRAILGDNLYHLARLSIVLGHVSAVILTPIDLPSLSVPSAPIIGTLLRGELERVREDFPASFFPASNCPLIHLCYWALRILLELRLPDSEPQDLLVPAMHIVTQLTYNAGFVSPLTYHATALAVLALIELTGYDKTRAEASSGLKSLMDNRIAPSAWDGVIKGLIAKKQETSITAASGVIPSAALTASQGLQRLADLATATEEGSKESEQTIATPSSPFQCYHDLREIVRNGYLNAFAGVASSK